MLDWVTPGVFGYAIGTFIGTLMSNTGRVDFGICGAEMVRYNGFWNEPGSEVECLNVGVSSVAVRGVKK